MSITIGYKTKEKKFAFIKSQATQVYDVANYEETVPSRVGIVEKQTVDKRKFSRNKIKMILNGSYIPIDIYKNYTDSWGYVNVDIPIEKLVALKKYPLLTKYTIGRTLSIKNDEDNPFALFPRTKKQKVPCGISLSMMKSYLQYINQKPYDEKAQYITFKWVDFETFHTYTRINFKNRICGDYAKKHCVDIMNLITFDTINLKAFNTNSSFGNNKCYGISSAVKMNHQIYPLLFIKCPCSFMGCTKCERYFNAYKVFQLLLLTNTLKKSCQLAYKKSHVELFIWFQTTFLKNYVDERLESFANHIEPVSITRVITNTSLKKMKRRKQNTVTTHMELKKVTCANCVEEKYTLVYKMNKGKQRKLKRYKQPLHEIIKCLKCKNRICVGCGHNPYMHKGGKCLTPVEVSVVTDDEVAQVQSALSEDSVETSKCPRCDYLVTKDENCDKVRCGAIDGNGNAGGCGLAFCFRCKEDISQMTNYIDHLIVTMKPDGSSTHWMCKKFAKACPTCSIKQCWDGTSDKIMCGECKEEFAVEQ